MKNAMKHAEQMKELFRRLQKEYAVAEQPKLEPLKALVRAAMSFDVSDAKAAEAIKHIDREFVDLNELRVATELEIQELLGVRYPSIEKRVGLITQSLNAIFEREHTLSLERLKLVSKREARQFLRDLPEMHPFVEGYVMLYALEGSAVPLDETMLGYLRDESIIEGRMKLDEAQRFVEYHLQPEECHAFFSVLRQAAASEGEDARDKKKGKG